MDLFIQLSAPLKQRVTVVLQYESSITYCILVLKVEANRVKKV